MVSPTARVPRGSSEAARCTSTEDPSRLPLRSSSDFLLGGMLDVGSTAPVERTPLHRAASVSKGG
jgi:hypothetical protein